MGDDNKIFSYSVGGTDRYADPLDLELDLRQFYAESGDTLERAKKADPVAIREMVGRLRKIFDLPPVDSATGVGVSGNAVLGVFAKYQEFIGDLKNEQGSKPDSPNGTEPECLDPSTTGPDSACTSGAMSSTLETQPA